jgi:hypothetical protein
MKIPYNDILFSFFNYQKERILIFFDFKVNEKKVIDYCRRNNSEKIFSNKFLFNKGVSYETFPDIS